MKIEKFTHKNSVVEILVKCDKVELEIFVEKFKMEEFQIQKYCNYDFLEKLDSVTFIKKNVEVINKNYAKVFFDVKNCSEKVKVREVEIGNGWVIMKLC